MSALSRHAINARRTVVARAFVVRDAVAARTAPLRERVRPVTSVVTVAAWVMLALVPVAVVAALVLGWQELFVAAAFLTAVLAIAVAFVIGRHQLEATLDLTRNRVVVGERANGSLALRNVSARRSFPLTIELPVGRSRADFDLPSLAPGAEHDDLFTIPTSRRAVLPVGPVLAVRSDPLGLLRRAQQITDEQVVYVHPRTVRIESSAAGLIRDLEGLTVKKLSDSDVAFHALRAYVPGDDRRYIHWKSTARTGTLMVRQFEETRRSHLLVVLSTRLEDYADDAQFELAVSVAGSLGVQAILEGHTLSVVTSTRVLRTAHAKDLLDQLAGVEFEPGAPRLSVAVRRHASAIPGASVVVMACGSVVDPTELRRARREVGIDVRTIATRIDPRKRSTVRPFGDLDVASLELLDDLPTTMRRLTR